ncbi:lipopolysaccharide biosynthesis protein [Mucilaginibacter segetis]|uniref:O-antigen/teichoic acid export membrane protein n=1 Tax=Mucilaginibacter segetis TaxID=2793071 RepID=A0A934PV85_9SPHI|nr:hypothetical protein [Mucilaginibacter segetis]MBK0380684.1 hypothetical protein [Mucilaginibacter segetis]
MKNKQLNFNRIWNSTTLMTWLSYFAKSGSLLLVLPLVLKKLSTPEIAVWTFFSVILSMAGLADFGFRNTFVRLFALARGGAKDIGVFKLEKKQPAENLKPQANWDLIEKLYSAMEKIYLNVSVILLVVLLSAGTFAIITPISHVVNKQQAWISWALVAASIAYDFYGKTYSNYLEGMNEIALSKRVEFLSKVGLITTSFLVLVFAPTLLNLIISNTFWMVFNVIRDYYLCRYIADGRYKNFKKHPFEKQFFLKIWQPAWRGGISGLMSQGLTNLSGILYAQVGNPAAVASYMIGLRIITEIRNVSNAPFYSKIPLMARLRAEGNYVKLTQVAQRGMRMAHLVYIGGAVFVGLFFNLFLTVIGSHIHFVDPKLWLMLTFAFYIHRYGALHMQLYNTTNHIISHIVDTVAGVIFIIMALALIKPMGIYAIPAGMLCGYLGFYAWYAAMHSLKSLNVNFFKFEFKVSAIPAGIFVLYTAFQLIIKT